MYEKKKKSLSFSEYNTYINCPHKWYLNYFLKLPSETNEELVFGSAIHASIQKLLTDKIDKKLFIALPDYSSKNIFKHCLKEELSSIKDIKFLEKFNKANLGRIFLFQASKLLVELNFFKRFKDYEIVDVEIQLNGMPLISTEEVDITYKGFIDLVLKHKITGRYLILDWKSSGKTWDIDKKIKDNKYFFAQLCLYKYFYSQLKNIPFDLIDTKFFNLPRNDFAEMTDYVKDINAEYFDLFFNDFKATALKIYQHSQTLQQFTKQKFVTKKNYCHRCIFNVPEFCNDDEFQTVKIDAKN